MENKGKIIKVAGPLVVAEGLRGIKMFDVVKVGLKRLIGEVIRIERDQSYIQVYEETGGLGPDDEVVSTGEPLSVELGPGLLTSIYDGIQRPLEKIKSIANSPYIPRGINVPSLDRSKRWDFSPIAKRGDQVSGGDVIGEVNETRSAIHRIMVPHNLRGKIKYIKTGSFTVEESVAIIETNSGDKDIFMMQRWPIRIPRPIKEKIPPTSPFFTGTRIIDSFFPMAKGGVGCTPGPFGAGKTVIQQSIAKWCNAEIIIYIGCGERGNEMTDILVEFPRLEDPKTGHSLLERTVIVANTSNMPVAAREASIYTGITLGEYYRDMGCNVAVMADSTSRWAEALREMSGRLEEMPGEEGYPAYLGSRTAHFYERAGAVESQGSPKRSGSLTVIGAVSPPGGDLSEPVTQNTLRVTKVFWNLDGSLAARRHFPSINWLSSYSLYSEDLKDYYEKEVNESFVRLRDEALKILQIEAELEEIVKLVGLESLSAKEQLIMEIAKILREDFLLQDAFDKVDASSSMKKQYLMIDLIMTYYHEAIKAADRKVTLEDIKKIGSRKQMTYAKFIEEEKIDQIKVIKKEMIDQISNLKTKEII